MGHSARQLRVENSEKGKEIPRKNLSLNVNWKNEEDYGRTAFYPCSQVLQHCQKTSS